MEANTNWPNALRVSGPTYCPWEEASALVSALGSVCRRSASVSTNWPTVAAKLCERRARTPQ